MTIANARYTNPEHSAIAADFDGVAMRFPAVAGNRHYDALLASGAAVAPYVPPAPTAEDVRAEASRRMQVLVGARDEKHLDQTQAKAHEEAIALLDMKTSGVVLTAGQEARIAELRQVRAAFEAIRAASNAMEVSPPHDFAEDRHWP